MKFSNSNSFFPNKIYIFATAKEKGTLAQVVEQWTENPCVLGSTPRGTTVERRPELSNEIPASVRYMGPTKTVRLAD